MSIVISHITALRFWLAPHARCALAQPCRKKPPLPAKSPFLRESPPCLISFPEDAPLDILASRHLQGRTPTPFTGHAWSGDLPYGSLFEMDKGVFICSPELSLLQSAPQLSLVELLRCAYQLCGTYNGARPRSAAKKLADCLERHPKARGRQQMARCLAHLVDGAASPREAMLVMHLCLPYRYGGYGLPKPQLNVKIPLSNANRRLSGKTYLSPDLHWPKAKLNVEYDSDLHHTGSFKIAKDAHRRDIFAHMGIAEIDITRLQFNDLVAFNKTARIIAKKLGKRISPRRNDFYAKQLELRRQLLAPLPWEKDGYGRGASIAKEN